MAIYTKITRRFFNKLLAIASACGITAARQKLEAQDPWHYEPDPEMERICDEIEKEFENETHMEVLVLPEHFQYPYPPKTKQVLYNHMKAGKTRAEIKEFILSQAKVIKVPLK